MKLKWGAKRQGWWDTAAFGAEFKRTEFKLQGFLVCYWYYCYSSGLLLILLLLFWSVIDTIVTLLVCYWYYCYCSFALFHFCDTCDCTLNFSVVTRIFRYACDVLVCVPQGIWHLPCVYEWFGSYHSKNQKIIIHFMYPLFCCCTIDKSKLT